MELQSEKIGGIAAALAKAQGEFSSPKKTATNPHLKKTYADLAAVREAVQPTLTKYGLAVAQLGDGEGAIVTTLIHAESGEWMRSITPIFEGNQKGAQGYGSGMTYARRYGLSAILGVVADDDDDGHAASGQGAKRAPPKTEPPNDIRATAEKLKDLIDQVDHPQTCTIIAFSKAHESDWNSLPERTRDFLGDRIEKRAGLLAQAPDQKSESLSDIPF